MKRSEEQLIRKINIDVAGWRPLGRPRKSWRNRIDKDLDLMAVQAEKWVEGTHFTKNPLEREVDMKNIYDCYIISNWNAVVFFVHLSSFNGIVS